jgi:hypothetical protein
MRTMCPGAGFPPVDRVPVGLPLAHPVQLLRDGGVVDLGHGPGEAEAAGPGQGDLGPDLDHQLELDRAARLELEVPDRRVSNGFQALGALSLFPALADHVLQDGLLDGLVELLPDDGDGALPGRNPGRRARLAYMATALSSACLTRSTPTVT